MRILQVATLISPDGAYGGPVRVALNQSRALQQLGHSVTLAAGSSGFHSPPDKMDDIPLKLFPAQRIAPGLGFAGLTSSGLLRWLNQNVRKYDVVHVHLARDMVTMPAALLALRARRRLFVQTHGMIDPSNHPLARPLDKLLTRRILTAAEQIFYLTETEKAGLLMVRPNLANLKQLINGVPRTRERIQPEHTEVLFLARLQSRKRPAHFVHSAQDLSAKHPHVSWRLVGPDEGEGANITQLLTKRPCNICWEGPVSPERVLERLSQATIYCLPSKNEPFPMSVLEAMSLGVPVVITDTCGLAETISDTASGLVTNGSQLDLTQKLDQLLSDRASLIAAGRNALQTSRTQFDMSAVARVLESAYLD